MGRAALSICYDCNEMPCVCRPHDPLQPRPAPRLQQNELEWLVRSMRFAGYEPIAPPEPPRRPPLPDPCKGWDKAKPVQPDRAFVKLLTRAVFHCLDSSAVIAGKMQIPHHALGDLLTGRRVPEEVVRRARAWLYPN